MPGQKLKRRKDGYFRCKYKGHEFYGKSQKEACTKRDEWIAEQANPKSNVQALPSLRFQDYAIEWLAAQNGNKEKASYRQKAGYIQKAIDTLQNPVLELITFSQLQKMCNSLDNYSSSYVSKFMGAIRSLFRSALADGVISKNPMEAVKRPKTQKSKGHRALESWERKLVLNTCHEHDFGLCAAVMMLAGLRRGEALFLDIDRDVDYERKTITVRGAISFSNNHRGTVSAGKTKAALRSIPLVKPLSDILRGHHGLLCPMADGTLMTESSFDRKYESYISFLETKLNGCHKRWYGQTREHQALLEKGEPIPPWKSVKIRCHDFRVDFCTQAYYAGIPLKTLQVWMGHEDVTMILNVYTDLDKQQEACNCDRLNDFMISINGDQP